MNKVIELYKNGLSIRKVSDETGISATQVRRILQKYNIKARSTRTDSDLEKSIISRYISGESSEHIADDVGLVGSTVCRILKRHGIKIRPAEENKRTYEIREDLFDEIDTQEKAYLLGFMYADGNVHKETNMIKIEVHEKDIDVLELFIDCIFTNSRPKIGTDRDVYRYITITSGHLKRGLVSNGCVPAKTFLISLPKLPDDLFHHFLRGFYDGDGCISIDTDSDRIRVILTGFDGFLSQIRAFYDSIGISSTYITNIKDNEKISELCVGTIDDANKLLNYLYKDATIFLNRKHNLFEMACGILSEKIKPPPRYSNNMFSYNGQHVSGKWLRSQSVEKRKIVAQSAFEYFRKYGFPYQNFSVDELKKDFESLEKNNAKIDCNKIIANTDAGLKIFKHYCHHYYNVSSNTLPSMTTAFDNDKILMSVIFNRMGITYKEYFNITGNMIRQGLRNSYKAFAASVFKPSVAKLIYDTYAPENSSVLDISMGFGQRMLGAAASNKVKEYVGLDPWKETVTAVKEMHDREIPNFNVKFVQTGSETFSTTQKFDLCFSSPPFFDKEIYTNDKSQAYYNHDFNKFLEDWWIPTVKMIHEVLKPNSFFILNMNPTMAKTMLAMANCFFIEIDQIYLSFSRSHISSDSKDVFFILKRI